MNGASVRRTFHNINFNRLCMTDGRTDGRMGDSIIIAHYALMLCLQCSLFFSLKHVYEHESYCKIVTV